MPQYTRRRFIASAAVGLSAAAISPAWAAKKAPSSAGFTLAEVSEVRLKVSVKSTRANAAVRFRINGKDPVTGRSGDLITWGPYNDNEGTTKAVSLAAAPYTFTWSGGGVQFTVSLEGRGKSQKNGPFTTLLTKSGTLG